MKHQYTCTFFNVNKPVFEFFSVSHLTEEMVKFYWAPSKAPVVSLSKKLYHYCLVLVGFRNWFEHDFTIELKWIEGLVEDWEDSPHR